MRTPVLRPDKPAVALGVALALHGAPALTARGHLRRVLPGLAGVGRPGGVALTFDDGPDPRGTPAVLDALAGLGWRATFFVLGEQARRHPGVLRRVVAAGHEIALHGHRHANHLRRSPAWVRRDLTRAYGTVEELTGVKPRWFRPPYGVLTGGTLAATRGLGLTPVLWTAWGRDWCRTSPERVARTVLADLREGGTVLLHDSDLTSTPDSWRATAASLPLLAAGLGPRGWAVRPLGEHLPA